MELTDEERANWDANGWLVLEQVLDPDVIDNLRRWVDELVEWSRSGGPGLHHHEQTDAGPAIARSERFADDHPQLNEFVRGGVVAEVLEALFGEPPILFKEKVNYKLPGGGGFAPHQDATAYRFVDHHISVMAPIDAATEASGCLWFAPGHHRGQLLTDDRGRVAEKAQAELDWRPVEVRPGDLVFFDSYAPHYSETNHTDRPRRAFYLTYNAAGLGDHRATYYQDKESEFAREGETFGDERVRISISDDFLGRPVERDAPTAG